MGKLKYRQATIHNVSLENRLLLIKLGIAISGIIIVISIIFLSFGHSAQSYAAPPTPVVSIGGVINSYAQVKGISIAGSNFTLQNM